jgi:hypothetical protein
MNRGEKIDTAVTYGLAAAGLVQGFLKYYVRDTATELYKNGIYRRTDNLTSPTNHEPPKLKLVEATPDSRGSDIQRSAKVVGSVVFVEFLQPINPPGDYPEAA